MHRAPYASAASRASPTSATPSFASPWRARAQPCRARALAATSGNPFSPARATAALARCSAAPRLRSHTPTVASPMRAHASVKG
jgi:hypothetical protein